MMRVLIVLSAAAYVFLCQGIVVYGQQPIAAAVPVVSAAAQQPAQKPVVVIKQLDDNKQLYSFELRDVEISDLLRILAHDYKLNLLIGQNVKGKVTASFNAISLEDGLQAIAENNNLILEKKGQVIIIQPHLISRIFVLKYIAASKLLTPAAASSSPAASASSTGAGSSTILDLLSVNGKVFLGEQPNSLMVVDYAKNIIEIEQYLSAVDQKMSSRVFKLKYLKASSILGQSSISQALPAAAVAPAASAAGSSSGG
jgi:type II secretory pathway component HofQ